MEGLILNLEILYFSTFRKPTSTSLILTYPIPPFTTIRGMISNALGLQRDDYSLQDKIKIGISTVELGFKNTEMAKILKLKENKDHLPRSYPSAPMFREYVVNPKYKVYLGGDEDIIEKIFNAIQTPERSLYLGQSDDLVDVEISQPFDIEEIESDYVDSIVEEIVPSSTIEKLPYKFHEENGKYKIEYKLFSIPKSLPIKLSSKRRLWKFKNKVIQIV